MIQNYGYNPMQLLTLGFSILWLHGLHSGCFAVDVSPQDATAKARKDRHPNRHEHGHCVSDSVLRHVLAADFSHDRKSTAPARSPWQSVPSYPCLDLAIHVSFYLPIPERAI